MDGYAVIAADVAGASADSPVTLPVAAEVAAGDTDRPDAHRRAAASRS